MRIVGILLVGLVAGVLAAGVSLASGGSLLAAFASYVLAGMIVTMLGVVVVTVRTWAAERPVGKFVLGNLRSTSE